jgi:agmatinase
MTNEQISISQPRLNSVQQIHNYDPNGVGLKTNIFGLPFSLAEAKVIILPVPWEVTVSYGAGTAKGAEAVFAASSQLDLFDPEFPHAWQAGIAMPELSAFWQEQNAVLREKAAQYIYWLENADSHHLESGSLENQGFNSIVKEINQAGFELNDWLKKESNHLLNQGKLVGVLGGDHSSPLGLMQALSTQYEGYSILQIDAHADLRVAYEGFEFSHASIMDNALKLPQLERLVQVGIRDICSAEVDRIESSNSRIVTFYDWELKKHQFSGQSWHQTCEEIISSLTQNVYVSFDIDGLDPALCPHTGTPVPGGLRFEEVTYLLKCLAKSGKKIIGFDLCEVAPGADTWDGNVGARILYNLAIAMIASQDQSN